MPDRDTAVVDTWLARSGVSICVRGVMYLRCSLGASGMGIACPFGAVADGDTTRPGL